jgi:hypothetical protein
MTSMMRMGMAAIAGLALVCTALLRQARGGQTAAAQQILKPIVGAGAQYEIDRADGTKSTLEMAVVGKEPVNGKDAYWFETVIGSLTGDIVMKALLVIDATEGSGAARTSGGRAQKMVMQLPGRPPVEMPVADMGDAPNNQMQGAPVLPQGQDLRDKADDLGSESVSVPAGTFRCEHYRAKDGSRDVWMTMNAPPYGLVKMRAKDQTTVLTKVLTGVQDRITETPEKFDPATAGSDSPRMPQ